MYDRIYYLWYSCFIMGILIARTPGHWEFAQFPMRWVLWAENPWGRRPGVLFLSHECIYSLRNKHKSMGNKQNASDSWLHVTPVDPHSAFDLNNADTSPIHLLNNKFTTVDYLLINAYTVHHIFVLPSFHLVLYFTKYSKILTQIDGEWPWCPGHDASGGVVF